VDRPSDIASALAALSEDDLLRFRAAVDEVPEVVPGLLAWLEHAIEWEIARRAGTSYQLQGPRAAVDDNEIRPSLMALDAMATQFRHDARFGSLRVADFLDITAMTLRAQAERPSNIQ
jgi:hypothetical protein